MVAGRHPTGFPLNLAPEPRPPANATAEEIAQWAANQRGASDCDKVDRMTQLVYGHDVKFHEITGLPLQQGSGCMPPDEQALKTHLPLIARRDGVAAAQAMYAKLKAATRTTEELATALAAMAVRGDNPTH